MYIYIYIIGSHSSSSKNSISQLFGLWMKTTTLVLGELLKGQIYVPSGSLVRHNMTSSEFRVLVTVSLATWLRVCCNSSFFGALDRSYQVVAVNNRWYTVVVNFITRDLILTASELASAEPTSSYEVWIAKLEFALLPEYVSPMVWYPLNRRMCSIMGVDRSVFWQ